MNTYVTLCIIFLILFVLGVLLVGGIENLIERKRKQERYIELLQLEIAHLKRTNAFLKIALQTKGGKNDRA